MAGRRVLGSDAGQRGVGRADRTAGGIRWCIGRLADFPAPGTRTMKLCSFDGRNRNLPITLCTARRAVGHPLGESVGASAEELLAATRSWSDTQLIGIQSRKAIAILYET
jgi:hypothetical protein